MKVLSTRGRRRYDRFTGLGLVVVLLGTIFAASHVAHAAFPGGNGNIVFTSDRDNIKEIYKVSANGGTQTRLTDPQTQAANEEPKWSPDGNRIVFTSDRDGEPQVYVMNADGTGVTQLTTAPAVGNGTNFEPAWSPDGTKIVYTSMLPARQVADWEIWVMNADGSDQHPLTLADDRVTGDLTPAMVLTGSQPILPTAPRWSSKQSGLSPLTGSPPGTHCGS